MNKITIMLCLGCLAAPFARGADAAADTNAPASAPATNAAPVELTGTNGLVLNFHDAPLGMVLDYLSEKAGYIVVSDEDMRQKITLESATPVSKDELRDLLNTVLSKNGYYARVDGRTLTIKRSDNAANSPDTPVYDESNPTNIPRTDTIVTQILPVHSLNPQQLIKDLDQLIPQGAKVTANEAGNAVIMTARQTEIHHFAEIVHALDSSAVASVAVFMLKYGDSKSVASELKEVFQSADSTVSRANRIGAGGGRTRFNPFGGGGGFGGFPGGGGGGGGNTDADKNPNTQAVFTSDDQLNAVVAAAPPEIMGAVSNIVAQLDQPVEDVTLMRVFRLRHADPVEMADELSSLFSTTGSDQNSRAPGFQFFRGPFGFPGGGNNNNSASDRMKRQTQVVAVADARTSSVIVTASRTLMGEIEGVITELDKVDAHAQVVTAIDISNADPADIESSMQALFQSQNNRSSSVQTTSPLTTRAQTSANQQSSSAATSFGTTGGGGGGSGVTGR
ncbi:MAG TPA: secretin N-terminal domain-containing protein [Verrucomicrobiae bacterium]|jgi:type II secretory pathway component GspD/PulD (secretin)|nr:secretin N-terminal domain-containing protein [Verrucomicrobiae bacterium]